ncbi:MAG: hypothetical protein ABIR51_03640, partial [Sphingomicrobium sp.]
MINRFNKQRLLNSAVLTIGGAFAALSFAGSAQAQCVVSPAATPVAGTVTCATTVTANSTNAGTSPAFDRNYNVDTSTVNFTGTVNGAITGYGLAFTNTLSGPNALNVVNNGSVQIDAPNTATFGGNSALEVTAIGATPVNYSGEGNVINLSTTAGHGLDFFMQGSGDLIANVGVAGGPATTITAAAPNSSAIQVNRTLGTGGNVTINTTSDTTLRAAFAGINIDSTGPGTMTVNNAATIGSLTTPSTLLFGVRVAENGAGTGAILINNSGNIGTATDRISTGLYANAANATSTASVSVINTSGNIFTSSAGLEIDNFSNGNAIISNGSGTINSTNYGIFGLNSGIGTMTVTTGTGAVTGTTVEGIHTSVTTGATAITTGSGAVTGATGINAVSTTGPQTIIANGVVTGTAGSGIVSNTAGLRTITVGTAGNVTGTTQSILLSNTGGGTVNNNGIIGAASTGLAINAATATAPVTVNNNGGSTLNGRMTLGTGADVVNNSGTFNTQGTTDFGAGFDTLNNNLPGVINLTGATTFANLETFNQNGTLNLNSYTLTGGPGTFTNGGTINTTGTGAGLAGYTALSNTGTMNLAGGTFNAPVGPFNNSGTVNATNGSTMITGQTVFNNSGTINLRDGATGDFLTIDSNYVGSSPATLNIDASQTASDRLIINGNAGGSTTVNATFLGGGLINIPGNLVVDNATSAPNAFVLGTVNGNTSPLVNYALEQRGPDYYLTAAPTAAAFDPIRLGALASSIWYQSADEVQNQTDLPAVTVGASVWGQAYYSQDRFGNRNDAVVLQGTTFNVDSRVKTRRMGIQAGVDYGFGGARVGLTGGYGEAKTRSDFSSGLKATGWNAGLYGQFGGYTGFHGSALVKHDSYKVRFTDGAFLGERSRLRANGVDGSLGYRFGMGEGTMLDAKVGLSHVNTKVGNIDAFGFNYDYGRIKSTRGRAGLRATFASGDLAPYIDASIHHEFNGNRNLRLFDGLNSFDLDTRGRGTWGRIEAGLTGSQGPGPILA